MRDMRSTDDIVTTCRANDKNEQRLCLFYVKATFENRCTFDMGCRCDYCPQYHDGIKAWNANYAAKNAKLVLASDAKTYMAIPI